MNGPRFSLRDGGLARLRATVATIAGELASLAGPSAGTTDRSSRSNLLTSWNDLVDQLALGPAPELRECPVCKHVGMRAATRCGYCWTRLTPPAPDQDRPSGTQGYDIGGEG